MGHCILGLGCDLVEVARFEALLDPSAFLQSPIVLRVLTEAEREEFVRRYEKSSKRGLLYLCTRFAAKEAFSKALGTGIGQFFSFQDVSVLNDELGRPMLKYSERFDSWMRERRASAQVSVSDEQSYALATVIVYVSE
jgi:holo-[acyl-carrier protein] synthase